MTAVASSRFEVRSYEVDSYAHLNNGVVVSWYEQGRLDFLRSLGFSYDGLAARQQWFVVARTEVDFRRPLHTGDRAVVETRVEALGRSSVRFVQELRRDGSATSEAARADPADASVGRALTVMVFHGADGRPMPIPDDVRARMEAGAPPGRGDAGKA